MKAEAKEEVHLEDEEDHEYQRSLQQSF